MPNASVHDFPSAGAYTGLEGVDTFYYWDDDAGEPRQLSLTELVKYALGNKTIGGVAKCKDNRAARVLQSVAVNK